MAIVAAQAIILIGGNARRRLREFMVGRVMPKEQKSAAELAEMIRTRLGEPELRVAVFSDAGGWHAKVYAAVTVTSDLQRRVNRASEQLRGIYDLAT